MEVPHIPRRACLPIGVDQSTNGAAGEHNHHAAPDQVGENIPESTVERQQRKAECRREPCPAAAEAALICSRQSGLQNAQEMYRLSLQMQADLNTFRNDQKLSLTIGTPHSFSRFSLPDILSDFYKTVSNIDLHIETAHSSQLIPLLEAETLDVAFIRGDIPFQGEKYLFSKDQVYLVSASPIDMKKLPTLPQIFYKKDNYSNQLIESWWNSMYDQAPNYILTVNDAETCHDMVSKGLGYGIFLLSQYIKGPHLHYEPLRFPDGSPLYRNTWVCFSNTPSLAKENFREFILKRIQKK